MKRKETVILATVSGVKHVEAVLAGYENPLSAVLRCIRLGQKKREWGESIIHAIRRTGIFKKIPGIKLQFYRRFCKP